MTSLTRGPLSPAVYWRRRLFVLGLAVALVMLISGALRGGSDGSDGSSGTDPGGVAEQVAGRPTSSADDQSQAAGRKKRDKPAKSASATASTTPLPPPTGECADSDVLVQPGVDQAIAGSDVTITLELRTRTALACTWQVSPDHLTLKITSGSDDIWASRHCPRSVPVEDVVVRQQTTTAVDVVWYDARRSAPDCTRAGWALPGYYHVSAAALGGEPADVQFRLAAPSPPVITETPDPEEGKGKNRDRGNPDQPGREN